MDEDSFIAHPYAMDMTGVNGRVGPLGEADALTPKTMKRKSLKGLALSSAPLKQGSGYDDILDANDESDSDAAAGWAAIRAAEEQEAEDEARRRSRGTGASSRYSNDINPLPRGKTESISRTACISSKQRPSTSRRPTLTQATVFYPPPISFQKGHTVTNGNQGHNEASERLKELHLEQETSGNDEDQERRYHRRMKRRSASVFKRTSSNNFVQNLYPTAAYSPPPPPEATITEDDRVNQQMALLLFQKSNPRLSQSIEGDSSDSHSDNDQQWNLIEDQEIQPSDSSWSAGRIEIPTRHSEAVRDTTNDEIRLRVDGTIPLTLQLSGDVDSRTLQLVPADNGMTDCVIAGDNIRSGEEHVNKPTLEDFADDEEGFNGLLDGEAGVSREAGERLSSQPERLIADTEHMTSLLRKNPLPPESLPKSLVESKHSLLDHQSSDTDDLDNASTVRIRSKSISTRSWKSPRKLLLTPTKPAGIDRSRYQPVRLSTSMRERSQQDRDMAPEPRNVVPQPIPPPPPSLSKGPLSPATYIPDGESFGPGVGLPPLVTAVENKTTPAIATALDNSFHRQSSVTNSPATNSISKSRRRKSTLPVSYVDPPDKIGLNLARDTLPARESRQSKFDHVFKLEKRNAELQDEVDALLKEWTTVFGSAGI
jgi:hypothetical protein